MGSANNVSTGTVTFNFTENTTRSTRSCILKLAFYTSINYEGTEAFGIANINQAATDIYIKTNTADTQYLSSILLQATATQTTFKVRADGGYTSTISSQTDGMGCTVSSNATASDDTEKQVVVSFVANGSTSVVTSCTVQFIANTNSAVRYITISQRILYSVVWNGGATDIVSAYRTDTSITGVSISTPWTNIVATGTPPAGMNCSVTPTSGDGTSFLNITFAVWNRSSTQTNVAVGAIPSPRICEYTITLGVGTTIPLRIQQYPADIFIAQANAPISTADVVVSYPQITTEQNNAAGGNGIPVSLRLYSKDSYVIRIFVMIMERIQIIHQLPIIIVAN